MHTVTRQQTAQAAQRGWATPGGLTRTCSLLVPVQVLDCVLLQFLHRRVLIHVPLCLHLHDTQLRSGTGINVFSERAGTKRQAYKQRKAQRKRTEASLSEASFSFHPGISLWGLFCSPALRQ